MALVSTARVNDSTLQSELDFDARRALPKSHTSVLATKTKMFVIGLCTILSCVAEEVDCVGRVLKTGISSITCLSAMVLNAYLSLCLRRLQPLLVTQPLINDVHEAVFRQLA